MTDVVIAVGQDEPVQVWTGSSGAVVVTPVPPVDISITAEEHGPVGPAGPEGPVGPLGPQGEKGDQGDLGDQGIQGVQGIQGEKGDQGVQGEQGVQGIQGIQGEVGPEGPQGIDGPQGSPGYGVDILGELLTLADLPPVSTHQPGEGYVIVAEGDLYVVSSDGQSWVNAGGIVGPQGIQGVQGVQGVIGPQGEQGIQGIQGIQGVTGSTGSTGLQGPVGPQGTQGPQGDIPVVELTTAEYTAIALPDPTTLYVITDGADRTLLAAARTPVAGDGINGDFFINTAAWTISGPKAAGAWPTAVPLVGPQGPAGATGPTGSTGAASTVPGPQGPQGDAGTGVDEFVTVSTSPPVSAPAMDGLLWVVVPA